ncbi:hypothetical protein KTD31_00455 [Burkholderia multivorans]|uniref:glyoxalase superfamily protein n=1 Tax=Burkholderia multivorans TaxID=87883 RepID=UPI001C23011B|nr:hypothetical protein [Burkholderia multivorans]MDN8079011.1 glyoxalase superfamily protein [Burkholderia multivorans]
MSLPSIPFLKEQANRLVAYLGDKHRFRLRSASALEAVAAMYGKPDWNTLQAMSARDNAPGTEAMSSPHRAQPNTYPLTWTTHGHPDFTVDANDWFRNTLAIGGRPDTRRSWLLEHLTAQLEREGAGVFLNACGPAAPSNLRDALPAELTVVDLRISAPLMLQSLAGKVTTPGFKLQWQVQDSGVNLLADLEPREASSMLCRMLLVSDTDDYYRQAANYGLQVVISAMQAARMPVTLANLVTMFSKGQPDSLYLLMAELDVESPQRKALELLLDMYLGKAGERAEKAWVSHYYVLATALERALSMYWSPGLFSDSPDATGLFTRLCQGQRIVIEGPERSDGAIEHAVHDALRAVISRRLMMPREEKVQGWVFGLAEIDSPSGPQATLAHMTELARSARVALLMTTSNERMLEDQIQANVWNRVYLNGCSREALFEWVQQMEHRPVLVQPGRISVSLR